MWLMICALPCYNLISHMEAADICSLPEGKYSEGSVLQTLFTAHWSHCNNFHEVTWDLAKPQKDPNSLFFMHPVVEETGYPLKRFPDLYIRTNKDSQVLIFNFHLCWFFLLIWIDKDSPCEVFYCCTTDWAMRGLRVFASHKKFQEIPSVFKVLDILKGHERHYPDIALQHCLYF